MKRLLGVESGFTLLEVMIALAIMLVAFSSILAIQSSAMNSALKSRQIHEVSVLARNAMLQTEVEISGKKFEEISAEHAGKIQVAKLNIDENLDVTRRYEVMSIPTLLVFKDGEPEVRIIGARGKAQLLQELQAYL